MFVPNKREIVRVRNYCKIVASAGTSTVQYLESTVQQLENANAYTCSNANGPARSRTHIHVQMGWPARERIYMFTWAGPAVGL
jgi:hypothetical protein